MRAISFLPLVLLLASPALQAAGGGTITYRRVFPGSNPEFIEIKVGDDGGATCDVRQLAEIPSPEPFSVGPMVRAKVFQLADRLQDFQGVDLDAHRKVANMGQKTLRYDKGGVTHEAQFNYTVNRDAIQLMAIFEGLFQQQQDLDTLEMKLKYDRLGVNDALTQFQKDLETAILPEPEHLLPTLDRIAADSRVIDLARQRARALAERIRIAVPGAAAAPPAGAPN